MPRRATRCSPREWSMAWKPAMNALKQSSRESQGWWRGRSESPATTSDGAVRTRGMMARTDFKSVDDYIAAQPEPVRRVLELVRSTVRKALPGAEEVISYQIPAYKL